MVAIEALAVLAEVAAVIAGQVLLAAGPLVQDALALAEVVAEDNNYLKTYRTKTTL